MDKVLTVINEYPGSHHYLQTYEKTDLYCAKCGKQEVWDQLGPGDYYVGNESYCLACGFGCFYLGGPKEVKDQNELGIIEQLRSGKMAKPTTPRGN